MDTERIIAGIRQGDRKALAGAITIIENEIQGYENILLNLTSRESTKPTDYIPIIGITGPPGSGKSTLVDGLIKVFTKEESKSIAVLCVDPSSPIHGGAILGDRLRMNEHFNNKQVFIRSLATRGALGGLSAKAIEITELLRASGFDYILIETAGVGQSEVEIASLADVTLLVLTPEAGDEIQSMKSGIMEMADLFAVNKADRNGADEFTKNLYHSLSLNDLKKKDIEIVKTIAIQNEGMDKLTEAILKHLSHKTLSAQSEIWAQRAYRLILKKKMEGINKDKLKQKIEKELEQNERFNVYKFLQQYIK